MVWRVSSKIAFVLAEIAFVGPALFHLPALPERIAVHFGPAGAPNDFATHTGFLLGALLAAAGLAALFLGAGALAKAPVELLNLPHKAHWFGAEREAASRSFLAQWLRWFAVLVAAFAALVMANLLDANLASPVQMGDAVLYETIAFLVALLGMILWLYRRFPAPAF